MTVTVMGATGNTGRGVVELLRKEGERVRALGRAPERLAPLASLGADVLVGDNGDVEFLTRAFEGADAVYALIPPDVRAPDFPAHQDRLGDALTHSIRRAGVKCVVFLSSVGADLPKGTGPVAGLHRQEERFRDVPGLNVLSLRPAYFFENHLSSLALIKHQGINGSAIAGDASLPMIATRDIAIAAAHALLKRDWRGIKVQELLGPRDLTMRECTRLIGAAIGKPDLAYVQFSYEDAQKAMIGMGLSPSIAGLYVEMSRAFNEAKIKTSRTLKSTTPTRFEDYARVLADAYTRLYSAPHSG